MKNKFMLYAVKGLGFAMALVQCFAMSAGLP